jgi:hypothetical protein
MCRLLWTGARFTVAVELAKEAYDAWPPATQEKFRELLLRADMTRPDANVARRLIQRAMFDEGGFRSIGVEWQLERYGSKPVAELFTQELCAEMGFSRSLRSRLLNALSDRWRPGKSIRSGSCARRPRPSFSGARIWVERPSKLVRAGAR